MTIRFLDNTRDSRNQILGMEGKLYSVSTGSQSVAASGYLALEITNPANSNRMIDIIRVEGGTSTDTTIDILRNADLTVSGSSLTPLNRNWEYSDSSSITVMYITQASDPVSGGDLLTSVVDAGGSLSIRYDGEFILPSETIDGTFSIRARNETGQVNTISIGVTWIEV